MKRSAGWQSKLPLRDDTAKAAGLARAQAGNFDSATIFSFMKEADLNPIMGHEFRPPVTPLDKYKSRLVK